MAQHYDVTNQLPPKVMASLKRLVKYAARPWNIPKPWTKNTWYTKEVTILPQEYAEISGSRGAMNIGPYVLNIPDLTGGQNMPAKLEVHHNGETITKVYWPL